ncbi:hypothetical protein T484DRAFT_1552100, partial [Baffinella frigidus]
SCVPCEPGTYKDVNGSGTCTPCPSNAQSQNGSSICQCTAGFTGESRVGEGCVACEAGTMPAECSPCEAGTYMDPANATGCTACPPHAVSAEGSASLSSCECARGFRGGAGAGGSCVPCEAGTYKDVNGSGACTPCPSNAES